MGVMGVWADGGLTAPASLRPLQGPGTSPATRNLVSGLGWEAESLVSVTFPSGGAGPGPSAGAPRGGSGPCGRLGVGVGVCMGECQKAESAAGVLQPPRGHGASEGVLRCQGN